MDKNIRLIGGVSYQVIRDKCKCQCHTRSGIRHIRDCCNNGFVEHLIKIKN